MCLKNYCPFHREENEGVDHTALWFTLGAIVTVLAALTFLLCRILRSLRALCRAFDSLEIVDEPEMEEEDQDLESEILDDEEEQTEE